MKVVTSLFRHKARVVFLSLICWVTACGASVADEYAGTAKIVKGTATYDRGGTARALQPGSRVEQGDRLSTGADGYLGVTLRDDTLLTLGPNTSLRLDEYAFDAKTQDGTFLASLQRGVLHVVTGLIPKKSYRAFGLKTPISTMGVRGTEFVVEAQP